MVDREARRGREFSTAQKRRVRERVGGHCQACGRDDKFLEIHHDPPVSQGGDRHANPWPLDHKCHAIADELAIRHGVSLADVRRTLGPRPLADYLDAPKKRGRREQIAKEVIERMHHQ